MPRPGSRRLGGRVGAGPAALEGDPLPGCRACSRMTETSGPDLSSRVGVGDLRARRLRGRGRRSPAGSRRRSCGSPGRFRTGRRRRPPGSPRLLGAGGIPPRPGPPQSGRRRREGLWASHDQGPDRPGGRRPRGTWMFPTPSTDRSAGLQATSERPLRRERRRGIRWVGRPAQRPTGWEARGGSRAIRPAPGCSGGPNRSQKAPNECPVRNRRQPDWGQRVNGRLGPLSAPGTPVLAIFPTAC